MDIADVRANRAAVDWWTKVYHHKNFQSVILQMLQDTHPLRYTDGSPVTLSSAEKRLGMIESYELALERLRLCTQYQPLPSAMPEATFAPPELEQLTEP